MTMLPSVGVGTGMSSTFRLSFGAMTDSCTYSRALGDDGRADSGCDGEEALAAEGPLCDDTDAVPAGLVLPGPAYGGGGGGVLRLFAVSGEPARSAAAAILERVTVASVASGVSAPSTRRRTSTPTTLTMVVRALAMLQSSLSLASGRIDVSGGCN